jgi:hypothetical protein
LGADEFRAGESAGDLEIAGPAEVAQYERWGTLLNGAAVTGDVRLTLT